MAADIRPPKNIIMGIGGTGHKVLNELLSRSISKDVFYSVIDTDLTELSGSQADCKIQIGKQITFGIAAEVCEKLAHEITLKAQNKILAAVKDPQVVIIVSGLGGCLGTGAAPVISKILSNQGTHTCAVVTFPFHFEGPKRIRRARQTLPVLRHYCDHVILLQNQHLLPLIDTNTKMERAFIYTDALMADAVMQLLGQIDGD